MQSIITEAPPSIFVENLSNRDYQRTNAISRSLISHLKVSLANFCRHRDQPELYESTPAMRIGSLVHAVALTPELLDRDFFIAPKIDRRTKEGKAYDMEAEKVLQGNRERVCQEELDEASLIAESLAKDKNFSQIMKSAVHKEPSIFYTCPDTQMRCKTRLDVWDTERKIICEIKTTRDFENFDRSVRDYDYHIQAAMQIEGVKLSCGIEIEDVYFSVVNTLAPYDVATFRMDKETIELGQHELHDALMVIKKAQQENDWSKDLDTIRTLSFKPFQKTNPFAHLLYAYNIFTRIIL